MSPTTPRPTTAPAADQQRLLAVQALDTRLAQIAHRGRALPEHAEIAALGARARAQRDVLVRARTVLTDVEREVTRAETEVEAVRSRSARTAERLAAGGASAKDVAALAADAEHLARRLGDLEDAELEVLQRQEDAGAAVASAEAADAEVRATGRAAVARRDAALAELAGEGEQVGVERGRAAAGIDPALLALYDRLREEMAGLGAAALQGDRCGGCRLPLTPQVLAAVRSASADAVVLCEECGRIVVRVPDPRG